MFSSQLKCSRENNPSQGLAVDIDDTLAASVHRWMYRLDQEFPNVRQEIASDRNLSIDELVKKYTFAKDVPYWGRNSEIHDRLVQIRTNPEEILQVEPITGAVEGLNRINEIIPIKCYFSTRPQSLFEATREWLKQSGFPDTELILTPDEVPNREADRWKVDLISRREDVCGIIDNSSDVVSLFPKGYQGVVFHFGVSTSTAGEGYEIIPCKEWMDVERSVNHYVQRQRHLSP